MTVSNTNLPPKTYTCNGVTTNFPTTFPFFEEEDLVVTFIPDEGEEQTLVLNTDYTVSGGNGDVGTVTTIGAGSPYDDGTLHIDRVMAFTQLLDLMTTGSLNPDDYEKGLDVLTLLAQQLQRGLNKSLHLSPTSLVPNTEVPEFPGRAIGWNEDGTGLMTFPVISFPIEEITGDMISAETMISIHNRTFGMQGMQFDYNGGNPRAYIGDGANEFFMFQNGRLTWKAANTELDASGNLIAVNVDVSGSITSNDFYAGNGVDRFFQFDGTYISWQGANTSLTAGGLFTASNANITGTIITSNITATGGTIGGWTLASNKISITGIELDQANNRIRAFTGANYVDITAGGITGVDSVLGTTFSLPTDGSPPVFSSGIIQEVTFEIYTSGVIKTSEDPTTDGGLLINNTRLASYDDTPTKLFEIIYSGTDKGDIYIGDYDNSNPGIKYDHSAGILQIRGDISIESLFPLPDDTYLIGHWAFDDGTGLAAVDSSVYGNHGTLEGSMTEGDWVSGIVGHGLDFDGSNDRVDCGNGAPLDDLGDGDFSISFWMKSPDTTPQSNGQLFSKYQDSGNYIELYTGTSNELSLVMAVSSSQANKNFSDITPFDTEKHHIALVVEGNVGKLYMDGVKSSYEANLSSLPVDRSNTGNVSWAARDTGAWPYEGMIDECRIYNKALTESEVKALYLNPAGLGKTVITGENIAAGTITATQIAADTITANEIAANTITATEIAAGTITSNEIAADTITASQINGSSFGNLTISSGQIVIDVADGLKIQGGGNITVYQGGDINLEGHDSNPGLLAFWGTFTNYICTNAYGDKFYIIPAALWNGTLYVGSDVSTPAGGSHNLWDDIYLMAGDTVNMISYNPSLSPSTFGKVRTKSYSSYGAIYLEATYDTTTDSVQMVASASALYFGPATNKAIDLARSSYAFDDAYADDWNDVADFYFMDSVRDKGEIQEIDDIAIIKGIKGSGIYDERTGFEIIDDDTLPKWLLVKHKRDGSDIDYKTGNIIRSWKKGDIARTEDGKPYISLKAAISLAWGGIRKGDDKLLEVIRRIEALEQKLN